MSAKDWNKDDNGQENEKVGKVYDVHAYRKGRMLKNYPS